MKFIVSSSALHNRLQAIGRVISSKNTLPILDCFLFNIEGNELTITASDNENTLTTKLQLVESESNIRFAVNAKTIQDAMKEIPEQPLDFYINEQTLEVTVEYQNGNYRFMGQSGDEYPTPPALDGETTTFTFSASDLLAGITRAIFATAEDGLRPIMTGIYFDKTPECLNVVASDGHKLVSSKLFNAKTTADKSFVLPKKPAGLLKNLLVKMEEEVTIQFNNRNAIITLPSVEINCRLIEGQYPNYNSVFPQNNPNRMVVNRLGLLSALRRVMIFSNATISLVKLELSNSKLRISSQDIDFSMSAHEEILCDYQGEPMRIGFKGPYLNEMLNNIEGDEVIFQLADSARAGLISPAVQVEGMNVLMLLMPMMLND
ncbi:MAG: DNA polymerase III subunit beta [Alloprevotella sp.]|nr:DNA polymerase III subunit beta [Bacteroidales bacterium]MDY3943900.1 DNA polymerase III subunit beta [Alloprevotella sp.]